MHEIVSWGHDALPCCPQAICSDLAMPLLPTGKVMRVKRRHADKACFNGPDFDRGKAVNVTCNCTLSDVECDYGYIRGAGGASLLCSSRGLLPWG